MGYSGDEKSDNDYVTQIIDLISESKEPLSVMEIAEQLNITMSLTYNSLRSLIDKNDIIEVTGKNNKFYISNKGTTHSDLSNMNRVIMQKTAYAKDNYEDLKEKFINIESKMNHLYANIITLMGIFVAIFSLINSNAKVVFDLTQTTNNVWDITISVIIMNLVTIISITILLIGVYCITKNKKRK